MTDERPPIDDEPSSSSGRKRYIVKGFFRGASIIVVSLIGFSIVFAILLLFSQKGMIYPIKRYERFEITSREGDVVRLSFRTSQGQQHAYYYRPDGNLEDAPTRLWIAFHGNHSLALYWVDFLRSYPEADTGFLLFDYPGYGECEGRPSAVAIRESSKAAVHAWRDHFGEDATADIPLGILGYSLGAAAGLQFAAEEETVDRLVLISPFTSLADMARRVVFFPFYYLLLENYDNRARLGELCGRDPQPEIHMFHGAADPVIPVDMSRELARLFPDCVQYTEVDNLDHDWILLSVQEGIFRAMTSHTE